MLSLRSSAPQLSGYASVSRPSRTKRVVVTAGKKGDLEEAWQAQQELLAERRRKAEEQMSGMNTTRYVPKTRDARPPPPPRAAKAEPKLLVEDEDAEEEPKSGNALGGFLGKLFGKK